MLAATSGDTGTAVAHSFATLSGGHCLILTLPSCKNRNNI